MANALSRQADDDQARFLSLSEVRFEFLDSLRHENRTQFFMDLYRAIKDDFNQFIDYEVREGLLLYKGKLLLDPKSSLILLILRECDSTPMAGHGGIQKTISRVCLNFTWDGLKKNVQRFVKECPICQKFKYSTQALGGLLQLLPIPI